MPKTVIAVTGSASEYVHKNIYDIAGNMYEWTMEAYSTNKRVARGGSYNMNGGINATNSAASRRQWGGGIADNSWANVGFRVALYI